MNSDNNNGEAPLPEESHIKKMFYYSFSSLLILIGCRFAHFQLFALISDAFTCILIWLTVCTMNKFVSAVSLVNGALGLLYALFESIKAISELKNVDNFISAIIIIAIIVFSLLGYSICVYASYFGYQVFGYSFQNNMNDQPNDPPGYSTIAEDFKSAKDNIVKNTA